MQARGRGSVPPPIGIAFEGDLGNRIDAVLALAMLEGFAAKGEARNVALAVSGASIKTAQLADVVAGFYSPRPVGGSLTIGMPDGPAALKDAPPLAMLLNMRAADGSQPYSSNIAKLADTPDNAVLIRNMLLAQNDGNATIVVAGPATGVVRLMNLYGARPQITAKVKLLVVAMGAFGSSAPESAVTSNVAAARALFADWPTPIVAVGAEVGATLPYPAASIDRDFAWSPTHPIAEVYRLAGKMPYDAPASALAAMTYAVHPGAGYFKLSEPGTITVSDDGRTMFTPGAAGKHRYLIVDPAQGERVAKLYTETVSARPAARPGRGGRGAVPAAQPPPQQPASQPAPAAPPTPPAKPTAP